MSEGLWCSVLLVLLREASGGEALTAREIGEECGLSDDAVRGEIRSLRAQGYLIPRGPSGRGGPWAYLLTRGADGREY